MFGTCFQGQHTKGVVQPRGLHRLRADLVYFHKAHSHSVLSILVAGDALKYAVHDLWNDSLRVTTRSESTSHGIGLA